MKNFITILILSITLINCDSANTSTDESVFFGGQIVNPKAKYVVLMKGEQSLDTIPIITKNIFSKKFNSLPEGLYSFKHGPEFQHIYFEKNDSISIRLNTWDFDESLVFSGKGAEKNNFLITLYLQNEKNERKFSPYYNLKPEEFINRLNIIENINEYLYSQLQKSGVELTTKFQNLAKVAISFPVYRQKESYPYIHKNRFQLDSLPLLPENYYDHRKGININNKDLIDYYPFNNYVRSYLYSLAYKDKSDASNFTEKILNIIVTNIKVDGFKNQLLYQAMYNDFRENYNSCSINKKALTIFNKHCTDESFIDQINALAQDCESLELKTPIENFQLATFNKSKVDLKSIIKNKKAVIYFWSPEIMNQDMLIKRVKRLNEKHPSLLFVGVNMKPNNNTKIYKSLENQFILTKESTANKFLKSLEPRTILVDENGIITNNFTYLSSQHLEKQLDNLERK